jgi:hypothetical protein
MLSGPNDESPANVEAAVSSLIVSIYLIFLLQPLLCHRLLICIVENIKAS